MKNVTEAVGRWFWRRKWWIVGGLAIVIFLVVAPAVWMRVSTSGLRFAAGDYRDLPDYDVAIVFGAGVLPTGEPSPYLKRRLDSAVSLHKAGKVSTLLLSGDNRTIYYNEPVAMQRYVMEQGVEVSDVVLDYAGLNTYDSCYRAKAIFGVEEAILISQTYHLPRAVWTCNQVGVESVGVAATPAGNSGGDYTLNYLMREIFSADKAALEGIFKPPPTILGDPEPISKN